MQGQTYGKQIKSVLHSIEQILNQSTESTLGKFRTPALITNLHIEAKVLSSRTAWDQR